MEQKRSKKLVDLSAEIASAVEWWGVAIRDVVRFDNGDDTLHGTICKGLAAMVSHDQLPTISDAQIDLFKERLSKLLKTELKLRYGSADSYVGALVDELKVREGVSDDYVYLELRVDYDPDITLRNAAEEAGFSKRFRFPWKTNMIIESESVRVSHGYGAPFEEIFKRKVVE